MSTSKTGHRTKVVVRRLPPALTEEGFRQTLGKLLEELKHDWFAFYPGKASQKRVVFSRAYINFTTPEAVYEFKLAFDGHLFVGTKGNQYRCSVEYAPYQKIPLLSAKKDNRDGTIFKDPDYLEFLKLLEQGPDALPSASAQLEAQERAAAGSTADGAAIITPLMEFLMDKYASHPNMKLGGLKKKKKDEAAAAAAEASKALLKRKQKHEDMEPHAKDKNSNGPGAAAPSPASKAGGKHPRPKQEAPAPAPVVVLMKPKPQEHGSAREANSREGGGHARPGTGDRGAGAKHGVAHHDKPAAKPDSRPARQQQQQQQQQPKETPHPSSAQPRTAAAQPSRGVAPAAAAAAAAAAALQRIPASSAAAAAGAGAAGDGDDQRARKVRAGFQAYTPGALRSGTGRPQQGNKHDSG